MITIAFVCTGNICRSVMAEAFFRKLAAAEIAAGEIEVVSAGIAAEDGCRPMPQITAYMHERGMDVGGYRSRPVDPAFISQCDLLLTMTLHNSQRLLTFDDEAVHKAFTLKEFVLGAERNGREPAGTEMEERLRHMKRYIRHIEGLDDEAGGDPASLKGPMQSFFLHYFHLYDQDLSIDDPLGQSEVFLERCAREIEDYTERFYRLLK
jgi:protein-tyrosine-phosphatase